MAIITEVLEEEVPAKPRQSHSAPASKSRPAPMPQSNENTPSIQNLNSEINPALALQEWEGDSKTPSVTDFKPLPAGWLNQKKAPKSEITYGSISGDYFVVDNHPFHYLALNSVPTEYEKYHSPKDKT